MRKDLRCGLHAHSPYVSVCASHRTKVFICLYVGAALPPLTKSRVAVLYVGAALPPLTKSDRRR